MVRQQCQAATSAALSSVKDTAIPRGLSSTFSRPQSRLTPHTTRRFRTTIVPKAEQTGFDIDAVVEKLTAKYEAAENKTVVIGYGVGGLFAFLLTEYIIHLPLFDVLVGFPVQAVGVVAVPLLIVRYALDKKDWYADLEGTLDKIGGLLPGLKK